MRDSPGQFSDVQCQIKDLLRTWIVFFRPLSDVRKHSRYQGKSRAENGVVTDQVKTHSVLISCAIDQLREHRDLLLVCRYAARALRGHCALKVDVIAITPNAAANSGREPSLSVNFI